MMQLIQLIQLQHAQHSETLQAYAEMDRLKRESQVRDTELRAVEHHRGEWGCVCVCVHVCLRDTVCVRVCCIVCVV